MSHSQNSNPNVTDNNLTLMIQTPNTDGFYGKNAYKALNNGIYHQGLHHSVFGGTLTLSAQFYA